MKCRDGEYMNKFQKFIKNILYVEEDEPIKEVKKEPAKRVIQQPVTKEVPPEFITLEKPKGEPKIEKVEEKVVPKEEVKPVERKRPNLPYKMTDVISPVYGEDKK